MTDDPEFLTVEDVIDLHAQQLARYGGAEGLRDRGLLESAVATPYASLGGQFAHEGIHAMADADRQRALRIKDVLDAYVNGRMAVAKCR